MRADSSEKRRRCKLGWNWKRSCQENRCSWERKSLWRSSFLERECCESPLLVKTVEEAVAKWRLITNHVQNVHHHSSEIFPVCAHLPLEQRAWLKPNESLLLFTSVRTQIWNQHATTMVMFQFKLDGQSSKRVNTAFSAGKQHLHIQLCGHPAEDAV
ncbi:hypothetical protein G5714_008048 [Onychostoma macrolepis]|uniref:Uncharacterized protein n=1 Tax=Onychostoma macrolepis TaxID=369639 RepID=A0A7J6CUJ0_9TELE|nr:hypothetical protein G5714_008048 [Onychostoma macrolepis]